MSDTSRTCCATTRRRSSVRSCGGTAFSWGCPHWGSISRAKQKVRGAGFGRPDNWAERLPAVLHTLCLIFNEGYAATSGRDARTGPGGDLVPLDEQDCERWDKAAIEEGVALVTGALSAGPAGPYQLRAAIAAIHDEAPSADATDWREILGLYDVLVRLVPGPVERLNRAVAVAMVRGPEAGREEVEALKGELEHRRDAVRGHPLERAGDHAAARAAHESAAAQTMSLPEQRCLRGRAARLAP